MFDLVIAKYEEDIYWAEQLNFRKFIYNKSYNTFPNSTKLENIGREAHTWAYHIVANYKNLNEYTIFVQGDPFWHFKSFIQVALNLPNSLNDLQTYGEGVYGLADYNQPEDLEYLKKVNVRPDAVLEYIKSINKKKNIFQFAWGAQYIVHKNNITCKPIQFWKRLVTVHNDTAVHWPWSLERCWPDIFNNDMSLFFNVKLI
jgi:hypothetical protein